MLRRILLSATLAAAVAATTAVAAAQTPLTRADSALVGRVLLAEDRRDSADAALAEAARHPDARIVLLARRAIGRIRDPRFAARAALPPMAAPPTWPEPAWRLRFRALAGRRGDCGALYQALADPAVPVRLRAMDLADSTCARDTTLAVALADRARAIARIRDDRRRAGEGSWHEGAHAMLALARLRLPAAGPAIAAARRHPVWQLRMYGARAATAARDTTTLRALAADRDDNVAEAAIDGLSALVGHAADSLYLAGIGRDGAQVVRAAATALAGSPRSDAAPTAAAAFDRWVARQVASAHDARVALLKAAGRPATDDRPPPPRVTLPDDAVALALGAERRLVVEMDARSGGGRFVVRLRGDAAPMMAARIQALARRGYYDGLTWHRVEHDFVIQGGSPSASEYVGLDAFLRDELGTIPHPRGTVGMSTRGHDTGDAQWFVNLRDNARLLRDYTVWAEVVEGIAVVDGILEGDRIRRIRPVR